MGLLGLGVAEPMPSWGSLLRDLERFSEVKANPWLLAPAAMLVAVVISFQIVTRQREREMMKVISLLLLGASLTVSTVHATELRFCLRNEPKTFDPAMVEDEASEAIRYLTGGVLMRVNRLTQELEPELAVSWKVTENGRAITLHLRDNVKFSDGTPFSSDDVAYTFRRLLDPSLHSATGDAFRSGDGNLEVIQDGPRKITLRFPAPVAGLDRMFDQAAIQSAHSSNKDAAVLGPFRVKEYKPAAYVALERNPNYWKRDSAGHALPYLDAIHLDIQQNREIELLRFERGELQLINTLEPEHFERLSKESAKSVYDSGPGMDSEFFWFNQSPAAPIAAYKKAWFSIDGVSQGDFAGDQSRRSLPHRVSRTCDARGRSGVARKSSMGECGVETAGLST